MESSAGEELKMQDEVWDFFMKDHNQKQILINGDQDAECSSLNHSIESMLLSGIFRNHI